VHPGDEQVLVRWLADAQAAKAVHGAKVALHALAGRGMVLGGVVIDTELAAYLCHPDQRGYDLADLAVRYLRRELVPEAAGGQAVLDLGVDGDADTPAAARAHAVLELGEVLAGELEDRGATRLLAELELPLVGVLASMEATGITADVPYLTDLEKHFAGQVAAAATAAYDVIGHEVNLGSPKQLQEVLFEELGMPRTKRIKTGYTTDAAALADLYARTEHPFLAHLLEHRDAS